MIRTSLAAAPRTRAWPAVAIAIASCAALCAACGTAPDAITPATPPTAAVATVAAARHEVACIDVTSSVPHAFTRAALAWFADRIPTAVAGPMEPATFYIRATSSQSYSPDAALGVVELPGVVTPPATPALPTNPYESNRRRSLTTEYDAAMASWQQRLTEAQGYAQAQAATVRELALPTDTAGTDVIGCELRAGELLAGAGTKRLFVSGDLTPNGPQQDVRPELTGVDVTVAYWCAETAERCDDRRTHFTALLAAAGAAGVRFLDPQQLVDHPGGT